MSAALTRTQRTLPYFVLSAATVILHWPLFSVGLGLMNADFATEPLMAEDIRRGNFSPFHFGQSYGGKALTAIRALWNTIWEWFASSPQMHVNANLAFSYFFVPALFAGLSFYLVSGYCSRKAAWVAGLLSAVGLQFISSQFGNDSYWGYLLIAFFLLGWKGRYPNPFLSMSGRQLFVAGILSGLSIYIFRAALLPLLVFWVPIPWAFAEIKGIFKSKKTFDRIFVRIGVAFLFLFFVTFVFGQELGSIFGRPVRIHAAPNLHVIAGILFFLWIKNRVPTFSRASGRRVGVVAMGFFIGLLPEIHFWITSGSTTSTLSGGALMNIQEFFQSLGRLPHAFREFVTGGPTLARELSLIFSVLALASLFRASRKNPKFVPFLALFFRTVLAFCSIHTYTHAQTRYLLPLLPALVLAWGLLIDEAIRSRKKIAKMAIILILCAHAYDHLSARAALVSNIRNSRKVETVWESVKHFQSANVKMVFVDDYWQTNQYTVASHGAPKFVPLAPNALFPRDPGALTGLEQVGLLLTETGSTCEPHDRMILEVHWAFTCIASLTKHHLLLGVRKR